MEWKTMESAPRDGTEVVLTWFENGEPQEQWTMRWNPFGRNPLVQSTRGIWEIRDPRTQEIVLTWSEANHEGAPTHYRLPEHPHD